MRDSESGEVEPQKQVSEQTAPEQLSPDSESLSGDSADGDSADGDSADGDSKAEDDTMSQSADGLLTVRVRITEANKEVSKGKEVERNKNVQASDRMGNGNSGENDCGTGPREQQKSNNTVPELKTPDQPTSLSSNSPEGRIVRADSQPCQLENDKVTEGTQNTDSGNRQLSENTEALTSSPVPSSPSTVPTLYNTPKCNKKAVEDQSQKELQPDPDPQAEKEKGVVWQTLTIGGKKVKYKVLGNVKVQKGSPSIAKQASPTAQKLDASSQAGREANKSGTIINKTGTTDSETTANKPGKTVTLVPAGPSIPASSTATDKDISGGKLVPVKIPLKDLGKNFKLVKVVPGLGAPPSKRGRPPSDSIPKILLESKSLQEQSSPSKPQPAKAGRPKKSNSPAGMSQDIEEVIEQDANSHSGIIKERTDARKHNMSSAAEKSTDEANTPVRESAEASSVEAAQNGIEKGEMQEKRTKRKDMSKDDEEVNSDPNYEVAKAALFSLRMVENVPKRRCSPRKRKPMRREHSYLEEDLSSVLDLLGEDTPGSSHQTGSKSQDSAVYKASKKSMKDHTKSSRLTRWPYQEIRALAGFLLSAKKAGVYKKEWPTMKDNESFWDRAADCCNVVRLDKKKRTGAACAHWTHCYLKPKFVTTSQMSFHFNSIESKSAEFHASPDQYETCKCYRPSFKKSVHKGKGKKKSFTSQLHRDRSVQATTLSSFKETQTSVSTVSVSNGLKEFVSMLTADDALEVADLALHYALKEKKLYNVADNFLELCVGAFGVLQKYRQTNLIEEFARVLSTNRDDGLPRMQPDKMPFAMIAYNIRYFNNTSPFGVRGLTVPIPYAEWLHSMYNIFGQRFHELFEGPTPDKMEIADRHPYRSQLLNVATVSKAYLKRQTDEKDKAAAENPPEESEEGSQDAVKKKLLMNRQGRALRELMTDVAIPPLARRKLQQAFAIIQRTTNVTKPDNEPTCEHCGAAIPRPPKPTRKRVKIKRDRKRIRGDGAKNDGKKRRIETSKSALKQTSGNTSKQGKGSAARLSSPEQVEESVSRMKRTEPQQRSGVFPTQLYPSPAAGPLNRMLINAPGIPPARELPESLQDKWIPSHPSPSQQGWSPERLQQVPVSAAVVAAAAARGVYSNQGTVDIIWQPGQPSTGWQHVRTTPPNQQPQQQQQQPQRTQMEPTTSSSSGVHIGQAQGTHSYY